MDVSNSQIWFTDLWNYSLVPYIVGAVKEGLELYGKKAPWEDPALFLIHTYPWSDNGGGGKNSLQRVRPEDVGYELGPLMGQTKEEVQGGRGGEDPLVGALIVSFQSSSFS